MFSALMIALNQMSKKDNWNEKTGVEKIGGSAFALVICMILLAGASGLVTIVYNTIAWELNWPNFSLWFFMAVVDLVLEVRVWSKQAKKNQGK